MRVGNAVVGRKWLGAASCVSYCGRSSEPVCSPKPSKFQQKGPDLNPRLVFCSIRGSCQLGCLVYQWSVSFSQTAWMRQIIMQVNMQPAVVRTHRKDQALVAQTPTLHGERMCAEARLHRFDRQMGNGILT
jgi:hypothetical protein